MKKHFALLATFLFALALPACGDGDAGTDPDAPLELTRSAAHGGTFVAGGTVPVTLSVSRGGQPVTGTTVRFSVVSDAGGVSASSATTDGNGDARAYWYLGIEEGEQRLRVRVEGDTTVFVVNATEHVPGEAYFGRNEYNEYQPGELPIVISAPHGGSEEPVEIEDRTSGVLVMDGYTQGLARHIADELEAMTGSRPHLVISRVHRKKVELNRDIETSGASGNPVAERMYHEYHQWIEAASDIAARDHGGGFYLDVHAHGHDIQRHELGYLLSGVDLANPDDVMDQPALVNKSSIAHLANTRPTPFHELIRGEYSLGQLLDDRGYPAVPSAVDPHPDGEPYFNGGYSTARHGSRDGGVIDGAQIETNFTGVRDTPENREAAGRAIAEALVAFLERHTDLSLVD